MKKLQKLCIFLIGLQALHSLEEFSFGFYDVFPLISFMAGFFKTMPQAVFGILNLQLLLFLIIIWILSLLGKGWFRMFVLVFSTIELFNGIFHLSVALITLKYYPGAVTGSFMIPMSLYLLREARKVIE
ncbi:MAG: HXXEE domain-containing protein [Candidatus Methanofastidiosia archaeon]